MRTLFDFDLQSDPRITVDRRAKLRDRKAPTHTDIRWIETYQESIRQANKFSPTVIIKENGSCLLFGSGGSGLIWVCTSDGVVSEKQSEMVEVFMDHLHWLGAVKERTNPLRYFDS